MSPRIVENHRTVTSKSQKIRKNTPEYGYQVLLKQSKQQFGGIPPCISCFFGARILGRVHESYSRTNKWWAFRPAFRAFLALEI